MKLMVKSAKEMLAVLDETKEALFKDRKCTYPYTEWEHKRAQVKERLHHIPEYIHQAVEVINREEQKMGRPPKLDLEKKVNLFILVRFLNKSNRNAEESLQYFQPLFGVDVSYKYIERLYGDIEVKLALHNLFVLLLKEEGTSGDYAGDGTGYSVVLKIIIAVTQKNTAKNMFISSHLLIWAQECMLDVAHRGCRSGMLSIKRLQCSDKLG